MVDSLALMLANSRVTKLVGILRSVVFLSEGDIFFVISSVQEALTKFVFSFSSACLVLRGCCPHLGSWNFPAVLLHRLVRSPPSAVSPPSLWPRKTLPCILRIFPSCQEESLTHQESRFSPNCSFLGHIKEKTLTNETSLSTINK